MTEENNSTTNPPKKESRQNVQPKIDKTVNQKSARPFAYPKEVYKAIPRSRGLVFRPREYRRVILLLSQKLLL